MTGFFLLPLSYTLVASKSTFFSARKSRFLHGCVGWLAGFLSEKKRN